MGRVKEENKVLKPIVNIRDSYYGEYIKNKPNPNINVKIYMNIVIGYVLFLVNIN